MAKNYFLQLTSFVALACIGLTSCSQLAPPETIPAYMTIKSIHLDTSAGQGTNSNGINCAWVYIDQNPVGTFPLPCTFPVVAGNGTHQLMVFAGIKDNGEASTRTRYPFYAFYQENVTLTANQTVTVKPNVWYTGFTKFHWMEDFEGASISLNENKNGWANDTNMFATTIGAFEGRSGEAILCGNKTNYEGDSDTLNYLPKDGSTPVYLEFNYKSDVPFWVGMYYNSIGTQIPLVLVNASSTWNKYYVNLQSTIIYYGTAPGPNPFYIYFNAQLTSGMDTARFYLDNIKVLQ